MLPCEYCHQPTPAEPFMRAGVPPCCERCAWIPLVAGVTLSVLGVAVTALAVVTFVALP